MSSPNGSTSPTPMDVDKKPKETPTGNHVREKPTKKPSDPRMRKALDAYHRMLADCEKREQVYNEVALCDDIEPAEKVRKMKELKEAQDNLESSKKLWRKQHPQRLEFLSLEEAEQEKERREAKEKSQQHVVPKDLPVLQLAGGYKWNPQKVVHNSAAAFVRAFERELAAYGLPIEKHWERLLSRAMNDPQYLWLRDQLASLEDQPTWKEVSAQIITKYDTHVQKYKAMRRVVRMQQGANEPLNSYVVKFQQLSLEADMPHGLLLNIIFLSSLQPKYAEQALLAIVNRHGPDMPDDLEEVCQIVAAMKMAEVGEKREADRHQGNPHPIRFKSDDKPAFKRCRYCDKQWESGHRCQEYFDKRGPKKTKSMVQRAARLNDGDEVVDTTLPCKLKKLKSKHEYNDEVLTPITVQNHKIKALVDTGATFSALDLDFINKAQIKHHMVKGTITLGSSGTTIPRIGHTEPLEVLYNGNQYHRSFEIMKLTRGHPMAIGTDFMFTLGIGYVGLATSWNIPTKQEEVEVDDAPYEPNAAPAGDDAAMNTFMLHIQPALNANAKIPNGTFCNIPQSVIELNTPQGVACYRRQYEFPVLRRNIVTQTVNEWLQEGIIKEVPANIDNRWNSPLTFAPKKDMTGKKVGVRLCLDPRHINQHLPDDRHPLPLIRSIFEQLAGAKVFTTLDLESAFHRFKIHDKDQHKTTFTSVNGKQYMFVGCPFGLKPISAKFQRVMQILFADLPFVTTFVDDIVVYSKTLEQHAQHVNMVITRLTNANL